MTDNCDDKCEIVTVKEVDNVDSDKSFESCVNSVADGIGNVLIKDDDSERSFQSCTNINQEKTEDSDKKENVEPSNLVDDDEDDDIRPGSCRENPSSDDETSSWDENKDNWIYDSEYLKEAENKTKLPEIETTEQDLNACKEDLEYIIENHVTKDVNNPTFIPTNGKFYMHDLRIGDSNEEVRKTNPNQKNKSNESWKHDLYDERKQKPISKGELIDKYGADIRQKKNDLQEIKENKSFKRNNRTNNNNIKRYSNYRSPYYDYAYDYYDPYEYGYYYGGGDGYYDYDYDYYAPQYNSWNRSYKESNRNQYKNYKASSPEIKSKKPASKPPSKYSQISDYTDIKITVNLDNFGTRQIENIGNNSNKKTQENSNNFRRLDGFTSDENLDFVEPCNHSTPKKDQREFTDSGNTNNNRKSTMDFQKRKSYFDSNKREGANNVPLKSHAGENRKTGNIPPSKRNNNHNNNNNYPPPPPSFQRNFTKSSQSNYYNNEYERTQGKSSLQFYRNKSNVPDWANTKYEWDANCDFKDVIEEMPPLTEKEINQLQKRPINTHNNPPPPRFSREKSSATQFDNNNKAANQNNRSNQTFVPKRYSEFRNQSEQTPPVQQHQQQQQSSHIDPTNQQAQAQPHQIINYQQMLPTLEYYNNLQPLLLNMNQHPISAPANSPQQSSNTFSSIHHQHHPAPSHVPHVPHVPPPQPPPHMVSLSSLIQPGGTTGTPGFDNNNQQQFYIHPVYLPTAAATATVTRLNQFSQPFQPSYVSQTSSQTSLYPTHSSSTQSPPAATSITTTTMPSTTCNTPNVSQNSRPVLGRS